MSDKYDCMSMLSGGCVSFRPGEKHLSGLQLRHAVVVHAREHLVQAASQGVEFVFLSPQSIFFGLFGSVIFRKSAAQLVAKVN